MKYFLKPYVTRWDSFHKQYMPTYQIWSLEKGIFFKYEALYSKAGESYLKAEALVMLEELYAMTTKATSHSELISLINMSSVVFKPEWREQFKKVWIKYIGKDFKPELLNPCETFKDEYRKMEFGYLARAAEDELRNNPKVLT